MAENLGTNWNYTLESQHLVNNPNIYGLDVDLIRRQAYEAMAHSGYTVDYYDAVETNRDLYQDPISTWSDAIHINCIFEDQPKVKVLKELGWYSEDDDRPQIIYLPMYLDWTKKEIFTIHDESIIKIYYFGQDYPTEFRITDKRMDTVYGSYWICKLAPERLDNFEQITENGSHYLKRKVVDEDNITECSHSNENDIDTDNRVFQNDDVKKYIEGTEGYSREDTKVVEDQNTDENLSYADLIMRGDN